MNIYFEIIKPTKWLVLIILTSLLVGCAYSDNRVTKFKESLTIDDLQGVYSNYGEGKAGLGDIKLSMIFWPNDVSLDHPNIDNIEIIRHDDMALTIRAKSWKTVIKTKNIVDQKDFSITNNRLRLSPVNTYSSGTQPTSEFEEWEFGLDIEGNFRIEAHHEEKSIKIIHGSSDIPPLPIPVFVSIKEDVRFSRLSGLPKISVPVEISQRFSIENCLRLYYGIIRCEVTHLGKGEALTYSSLRATAYNKSGIKLSHYSFPLMDLKPSESNAEIIITQKQEEITHIKIDWNEDIKQ